MIKVVEFFRGRADLAPEAFLAHWQDRHGPIVLAMKGLRRYLQNPVMGLAGLPAAPYHGAVEAWFDSLQVMRDNARDPYWQSVVEDEARFIDRDSRRMMLSEARELGPLVTGPKLMLCLHKPATHSVEDFVRRLQGVVGALACPGLRELTCDLPIESSYDKPRALAGDAVLIARFEDWRAAEDALSASVFAGLQRVAQEITCVAVAERVIKAE